MAKLRWGILGTGNIARQFATALPRSRHGKLVAVGSRNQKTAEAFGDQFAIPSRHANYAALLEDSSVDAVYIATPHPEHARLAIAAAAAGKHILCEKPLAVNAADAGAIVEAAERNNVFLMEAFMYRCHPQTTRLVELIGEGAVGTVQLIEATFAFRTGGDIHTRVRNHALAGGGILDVGGYPVSMARLLAGAAVGKPFADPIAFSGHGILGEDSRVDEWAVASLKFPGDILAQVATGVRLNARNTVRVQGTEGWLEVPTPWIVSRDGGTSEIILQRNGEKRKTIKINARKPLYAIEADTVAQYLDAREAPAMSWEDSLGNMRVLDQWREAVGLRYDFEQPEALRTPVHGKPLDPKRNTPQIPKGLVSGLKKPVSRLVLGVDNQRDIRSGFVIFDQFYEYGGNAFDTAWVYMAGQMERVLGQWIANRGVREEVVVIGKGGHTPFCFPDKVAPQLDESLERLQTDYVDIYLLHRDNPEIPAGEFVEALHELHQAGKIGVYGGSNWSVERVTEANRYAKKRGIPGFVAVSNQLSLARMMDPVWKGCISASDPESRKWLEKQGMALFPWSSQARGFFTDRARPDLREDEELVRCWYSKENFKRRERAWKLAEERGVHPINIALAYVLAQPFPTFPLIGPRTLRELRTSLPALEVELTPEEVAWLDLTPGVRKPAR